MQMRTHEVAPRPGFRFCNATATDRILLQIRVSDPGGQRMEMRTSTNVGGAPRGETLNRNRAPSRTPAGTRRRISCAAETSPSPPHARHHSAHTSPRPPHRGHVRRSGTWSGTEHPRRPPAG